MTETGRALLDEVLEGAELMGSLAEDEETFRAVVDAFRAQDGESMHKLLDRRQLAERCPVVCHWLRSKEAVLLCLELAGPREALPHDEPDPRTLGALIGKLTADEDALGLMVTAVQQRDPTAWAKLVEAHDLRAYAHQLCHWVTTVHYRLVCEVVCVPREVPRPNLAEALRDAGAAVSLVAGDRAVFDDALEAVLAGRCEVLGPILGTAGLAPRCHLVCEWLCSWRCVRLCLLLHGVMPAPRIDDDLREMRAFAQATATLGQDRGVLERLAAATLRGDLEQLQALAREHRFAPYVLQFCHWVCFLRCRIFCRCVCPPRSLGLFTHIGGIPYATGVDCGPGGSDGLTLADERAFHATLRLNGGLSLVDGAAAIEYRFETVSTDATGVQTGAWTGVTAGQVLATRIGSFARPIAVFPFVETTEVWVNNPAAGVFNITPDGDGWIAVPPLHPVAPMVSGAGWTFFPSGDLIHLDTTTILPFTTSVDETGVGAGGPANPPLDTDVHHGVRMRIRDQGSSGAGGDGGTCAHLALDNTHYDNVEHHPYWPGGLFGASDELAVATIGIDELASAPCSLLSDSLTVQVTAAHTHLGAVDVTLEGPGGPYPVALTPGPGSDPARNLFGSGTLAAPADFASLDPCAYLLKLRVGVLLTTGDSVPDPLEDYVAFCKGLPRVART